MDETAAIRQLGAPGETVKVQRPVAEGKGSDHVLDGVSNLDRSLNVAGDGGCAVCTFVLYVLSPPGVVK